MNPYHKVEISMDVWICRFEIKEHPSSILHMWACFIINVLKEYILVPKDWVAIGFSNNFLTFWAKNFLIVFEGNQIVATLIQGKVVLNSFSTDALFVSFIEYWMPSPYQWALLMIDYLDSNTCSPAERWYSQNQYPAKVVSEGSALAHRRLFESTVVISSLIKKR